MMDIYLRTPRNELPLDCLLERLEEIAAEAEAETCAVVMAARNRIWRRERGELWTTGGP